MGASPTGSTPPCFWDRKGQQAVGDTRWSTASLATPLKQKLSLNKRATRLSRSGRSSQTTPSLRQRWLWLTPCSTRRNQPSTKRSAQSRLSPSNKDRLSGPAFEENLALVEMIIGENSRAISTLTRLLQTPYGGWLYSPAPITPALLRLDPIWDPLRADPAFQKLCL